jgi:hypothetical protein
MLMLTIVKGQTINQLTDPDVVAIRNYGMATYACSISRGIHITPKLTNNA